MANIMNISPNGSTPAQRTKLTPNENTKRCISFVGGCLRSRASHRLTFASFHSSRRSNAAPSDMPRKLAKRTRAGWASHPLASVSEIGPRRDAPAPRKNPPHSGRLLRVIRNARCSEPAGRRRASMTSYDCLSRVGQIRHPPHTSEKSLRHRHSSNMGKSYPHLDPRSCPHHVRDTTEPRLPSAGCPSLARRGAGEEPSGGTLGWSGPISQSNPKGAHLEKETTFTCRFGHEGID
jgi:hypothetical protein